MIRRCLLWASRNEQLRARLSRYRFFRRAVSRFMPGEDAEAALAEAKRLQGGGIATVFTLLGENITEAGEAEKVAGHYQDVLTQISGRELDTELSVKLTQLGLDVSPDIALRNLEEIVRRAQHLNCGVVWIDMEASHYVDPTLALFRRLREHHPNVGLCLQAYLYRTEADLKTLLPFTSTIRLVKGAYAEPQSVAYPKKSDVDRNYFKLAVMLLENEARKDGGRPGLATHDSRLIRRIQEAAREKRIDRSTFEFQMLYGIRRDYQRQLVSERHPLRVLVSYGTEWFPWYMRRLAERPANLWFVAANLLRA